MLKRLIGIFRPTPGYFLLKLLPLYLEETERPLKEQILITGSASSLLGRSDKPLVTLVKARAITAGCIRSAHHTAKYLLKPKIKIPEVSEKEYANFYHAITRIAVGSIDAEKNKIITSDLNRYTEIAQETMHNAIEISRRNIWTKWEKIDADNWKLEISSLYYHALRGSGNLVDGYEEELKDKQKSITASYAQNIGETHWEFHKYFIKELLDLFEAKRRYI